MLFVVLCPGTPKGSTGNGSDFKVSLTFYMSCLQADQLKQSSNINLCVL